MMRRRTVVTSVIALGFALSGQALAQGAPKPAPDKPAPAPAPAKPMPVLPPAPPVAPVAPPPAVAPPAAPPAAPAPAPAPIPPPAPVAPPPPADAAPPLPAAPAPMPMEPAPAPPPEARPFDDAPAEPEAELPPAEQYVEGGDSWYDLIEFSAFVDAYASVNYNFPKPQYGKNLLRAHDYSNGFALSWVGVNASYPADPVGATISLRFGPTARQIGNGCLADDKAHCDTGEGIENVKQAFASWRPGGPDSLFTLDLGKFDTPYGAEVAESHLNMNYTRSMLYVSQPVFHTGLRGSFAVSDLFDFKVLAVNGWNNTIDNNVGKSFGAQLNFHFRDRDDADLVGVSVGYLGGPEHDDTLVVKCGVGERFSKDSSDCVADATSTQETQGLLDRASSNTDGWRHLVDLVVTANPHEQLRLVLNADFGLDNYRSSTNPSQFESSSYYGVLLGARVAILDEFGVAARGEYFHDSHGFINPYPDNPQDIWGGTLTLDYLPADFLTIRLDNRFDWSSREIFTQSIRDQVGSQFTTTLGVVAHTD